MSLISIRTILTKLKNRFPVLRKLSQRFSQFAILSANLPPCLTFTQLTFLLLSEPETIRYAILCKTFVLLKHRRLENYGNALLNQNTSQRNGHSLS